MVLQGTREDELMETLCKCGCGKRFEQAINSRVDRKFINKKHKIAYFNAKQSAERLAKGVKPRRKMWLVKAAEEKLKLEEMQTLLQRALCAPVMGL